MKTSKYHNLVRINLLTWIITAITLGLSMQGKAQSTNKNTLLQMIEEDRTTIDAIAGYDQKIQNHILQVAQTPEVLKKVEELQKRSQNQFRAIINDYDRDAQAAFYEMARYPNLITDLVSNGKPSSTEVAQIVSNYPEDIHPTTNNYALRYFDVLVRIDQLNNEIDRAFQAYLEPYNTETRESVNALLAYPEIVSVLVEDKDFTSLLGAAYSEDPEWVVRNLQRISQELAEQNKEDLNAYKNQIENDPEAYNEMLGASEKFARENNEMRYLDGSSDPIVEVSLINSYPYWFGYPYWYSDPYWRPRPFYYHTGFYRNHFGNIVFVGLPSYHFMHWQTYYHPALFPHLSYNYYSYYENHYMNRYRNSQHSVPRNGFYRSIEANVINNPRVNNSNLERIDHQRGNNIVRRPNTMESGANRNGTVNRRGNENINRNGNAQRSSETTGGVVNSRGTERNNSGNAGNSVNRRVYNTINPGRSEGSYNRRGLGTGSGTIRRRATQTVTTPEGTPTGRSRQGTFANPGNNENPRSNDANVNRIKENAPASTTRRQTSSAPVVNRAAEQQQSAAPQERSKTYAPAVRAERSNSQPARSSASGRREVNSANVQPSRRELRREAKTETKAASRQSGSRNPGRGN